MPEEVIVNGKRCIEYSIPELEAIRNEQIIRDYAKRGYENRRKQNNFTSPASINPTGRKPRML